MSEAVFYGGREPEWPQLPFLPAAACKGTEHPEEFFPPSGKQDRATRGAKALCAGCIESTACLDFALSHNVHGVWGGTTDSERSRLRQGQPS